MVLCPQVEHVYEVLVLVMEKIIIILQANLDIIIIIHFIGSLLVVRILYLFIIKQIMQVQIVHI